MTRILYFVIVYYMPCIYAVCLSKSRQSDFRFVWLSPFYSIFEQTINEKKWVLTVFTMESFGDALIKPTAMQSKCK